MGEVRGASARPGAGIHGAAGGGFETRAAALAAQWTPEQVRGDEGGVGFAGYAAVFDAPDRGGDVIRPGAFARPGAVPLLWQHRGAPVGRVEVIGEDARGLRVVGAVEDPALAALVRGGGIDGLSIGYRVRESRQGARREIRRAELVEVSLVAQPMQPLARIHAVSG